MKETAWLDRDPSPQRSASSNPPANRAGIILRESNPAARFYTWGNSGIEPHSGSENQLSRNRQGPPHGALAIMENCNGALCWTRRLAEADSDLHRRSNRKDRARRGD